MFSASMTAYGETSSIDNPYVCLYAGFLGVPLTVLGPPLTPVPALWTVYFNYGWKRLQMVYQLEWGTIDDHLVEVHM